MLQPNRTKYRKDQKGRNYGMAQRGADVSFGDFGLKVLERGRLTARQIEAARRALTRHIKRGGHVWIRVFPDKPISKCVWVTVRATRSTGSLSCNLVGCFMKWTASMSRLPAKPLRLQRLSFR